MSVIIDNSLTVAWFSLTKEARRPMQCCGDPDTNAHMWNATVQLADLYSLTIYDAAYLGMAASSHDAGNARCRSGGGGKRSGGDHTALIAQSCVRHKAA